MKEHIDNIVRTIILGSIAAAAGVSAFLFLVVAAFLWAQQRYDSIVACGLAGGLFLLIAVIALIVLAIARNRAAQRKAREEAEAAAAAPAWLSDPALLLAGIQVARTIGIGRLLPLAVAGIAAFGAAGLLGGRKKPRANSGPEDKKRDAA